jgi:hypothetical protein
MTIIIHIKMTAIIQIVNRDGRNETLVKSDFSYVGVGSTL